MDLTIHLNNGTTFNAIVEGYNAVELAKNLNIPQTQVMSIGDVVISKNAFSMITPTVEDIDANVSVYLNNGKMINIKDVDYNAANFTAYVNDSQTQVVPLGSTIMNKHSVMLVVPISNNTTTTTTEPSS